jgi:hypothetical protein
VAGEALPHAVQLISVTNQSGASVPGRIGATAAVPPEHMPPSATDNTPSLPPPAYRRTQPHSVQHQLQAPPPYTETGPCPPQYREVPAAGERVIVAPPGIRNPTAPRNLPPSYHQAAVQSGERDVRLRDLGLRPRDIWTAARMQAPFVTIPTVDPDKR